MLIPLWNKNGLVNPKAMSKPSPPVIKTLGNRIRTTNGKKVRITTIR